MKRSSVTSRVRWGCVVLLAAAPLLAGGECTGRRGEQIREDVAPVLAEVLGSLGDLAGSFAASLIRPLPATVEPEPSLK